MARVDRSLAGAHDALRESPRLYAAPKPRARRPRFTVADALRLVLALGVGAAAVLLIASALLDLVRGVLA